MLDLGLRMALLVLVLLGTWAALRWAQSRGMTGRGVPLLRVVGRTGLTKSALVAVVEVGERRFLVGAGDGGVQLLSEIDPPDARAAPDGADAGASPDEADADRADLPDPADLPDLAELLGVDADLDGELADLVDPPATSAHGPGRTTDGPRIGPLDRLRAMTVRTTPSREPIRDVLHRRR